MQRKIEISVEPREGLVHTIAFEEDVVIHNGDSLIVQLGRDGEVASVILTTPDAGKKVEK